MTKTKKFFNLLRDDFDLKDKNFLNLVYKCVIAMVFQFIALMWKPFVFVELIYLLALIVFEPIKNKICYLFFMLPLFNVFKYNENWVQYNQIFSQLSSVNFSVILLFVFCLVLGIKYIIDLKNKNKKLNIKTLLIYILAFIFMCFPVRNSNGAFSSLLIVTGLFAAFYLIVQYKENWDLKLICNTWLMGILASIWIWLFRFDLPILDSFVSQTLGRCHFLHKDPNYWALELLTLIMAYTTLYLNGKFKYGFWLTFPFLMVLGIITNSKSFYICMAVFVLCLVVFYLYKLYKNAKNKKKIMKIIVIVISLLIVCGIVLLVNFDLFVKYLDTKRGGVLNGENDSLYNQIDSLTTGRLRIWTQYIKKMFSSTSLLLFGQGALSGYHFRPVHNTPLQLFYFMGIPAFVAFMGLLVYLFIKNKKSFAKYFCIIIVFVFACSVDLLLSYRTYLLLTICMLCYLCSENKKTN